MDMLLNITIQPNMSDADIRQAVWDNPDNGSYARKICRSCGVYWASPDGDARVAKILDSCEHCKAKRD